MFAYDWIRTADLWNWKCPLYQLIHNHCLSSLCLFLLSAYICFNLWLCLLLMYPTQRLLYWAPPPFDIFWQAKTGVKKSHKLDVIFMKKINLILSVVTCQEHLLSTVVQYLINEKMCVKSESLSLKETPKNRQIQYVLYCTVLSR